MPQAFFPILQNASFSIAVEINTFVSPKIDFGYEVKFIACDLCGEMSCIRQEIVQDCFSFGKVPAIYRHLVNSPHKSFSCIPGNFYLNFRVIFNIFLAHLCGSAAVKLFSYMVGRMSAIECRILSWANNVPPDTAPAHWLLTFHPGAPPLRQKLHSQNGRASQSTYPGPRGQAVSVPP